MTETPDHPEVPKPTEVSEKTRDSLIEWARDLTKHSDDVVLNVYEGPEYTQISVQADKSAKEEGVFLVTYHEPSTDYTTRHTFLTIKADSVAMLETVTVNPEAGETHEQREAILETIGEQDLLSEETNPVGDQEARARHVLELLPKAHIGNW